MSLPLPSLVDRREGVWVVNKPAGWLTHPAGEHGGQDLCAWLTAHPDGPGAPASPIHRLDRETSGLVALAADAAVLARWGRVMADHSARKTYLAVAHGRLRRKGIIRTPLSSDHGPQSATTRYRLVDWIGPFSLVAVRPEEGRRHQIRRHLASIGHPIVGDTRWATRRQAFRPAPPRLLLHAGRLQLDPAWPLWEVPPLPEFTDWLAAARARHPAVATPEANR